MDVYHYRSLKDDVVYDDKMVKRYNLPFFTIEKEFRIDENGKKKKVRSEILMCKDDKEIRRSGAILILGSIGFSTICTGIAKIISALNKKK